MKKLFIALSLFAFTSNTVIAQDAATPELPAISAANAAAFFIPASVTATYKLTEAKGDAWMKVYNNMADDAKLQRVNDIRWQASSKAEAIEWYEANLTMLSEDGKEVTDQLAKPAAVDAWHVYEANENMKKMMEAMGMKQNQYTYTFVVDKYVVKIFVGTNDATSLKESWSFVKEGLKAVLKASGNPKMAELVL